MRPITGLVLAGFLLTASVQFWLYSDEFDEWLIDQVSEDLEIPYATPIQSKEIWPVVFVDFNSDQISIQESQEKADLILGGSYSIQNYFDEISAGQTQAEMVYSSDVVRAQHSYSWYGKDSSGKRDVGDSAGYGPASLAQEAVEQSQFNWSKFDLDGDGWVDRLLILHSSRPQEDGSGQTNRIWSHHGPFVEPIEVAGGLKMSHYTMASMASENYRGTIYHEMLHQLGAPDLYPVHNDFASEPWKGLGDWDVMASGNWNENGRVPALPSAAVLEVIGVNRIDEMSLKWNSDENWCSGPQVDMIGMSQDGSALKIPIGEEEYVLIEARYDSGFDSGLPGNGILVTQLDLKAGDIEDNEVNSDPTRPWLRVIEADNGQDMINSNSEGEASDVFIDGSSFGREGVEIRDRSGILVDWQANVSGVAGNYVISFGAKDCGYRGVISLPDYGSLLIQGQVHSIPIISSECTPIVNLSGSKGTVISYGNGSLNLDLVNQFEKEMITGTINCSEGGLERNISHSLQLLGNLPVENQVISGEIHVTEASSYELIVEFEGTGEQEWNLLIDGAISRIAKIDSQQSIRPGDGIRMDIEPNGLLTPGMVANGVLIIADDEGHRWEVELNFKASEDPGTFNLIEQIRRPGSVIAITLFALAIWTLIEVSWNSTTRNSPTDLEEVESFTISEQTDPFFVDSFSESDR